MTTKFPYACFACLAVGCISLIAVVFDADSASSSTVFPDKTVSHYENTANARSLYLQGEHAGESAFQGIVILDFGRPAFNGIDSGTLDCSNAFVSFASIVRAVESYVKGYFRMAPSDTTLDVAVGTNNSCGSNQPCGASVCGCIEKPVSYFAWGREFAAVVETLNAWATSFRTGGDLTDQVHVVAGDDIEPAYDPDYSNTYDLLSGYAQEVGGSSPAMIDYGSADAHYWTKSQLFQVAYGFAPDVPMPEVYYYPTQVDEWSALLNFAKAMGKPVTIFGVLGTDRGGAPPEMAYLDMLAAAQLVTSQHSIPWLSTMTGQP